MDETKEPGKEYGGSKAKELFARFFRACVNGALGYGAWKLQSDPKWAIIAPVVSGVVGKALRQVLPAEHGWKVPF